MKQYDYCFAKDSTQIKYNYQLRSQIYSNDAQSQKIAVYIMDTALIKTIQQRAEQSRRPDGSVYHRLLLEDEKDISRMHNVSAKTVQLEALACEIVPERYCRNQLAISMEEQVHLLNAHVAVIGQGGLGGTVTELLSRMGIGALTLVDGDTFEESNLNRQLLGTIENLGKNKADAGYERVMAINPAIDVVCVAEFLHEKNAQSIINGADVVVDCLDSIPGRFVLEKACCTEQIPLVSAAIAGSVGQATVIFPEDKGLEIIYGDISKRQEKGIEKSMGTLGYAAMFMAAIECAEVVSLLCKNTTLLRNTLFIAEIDEKQFEKILLPTSD